MASLGEEMATRKVIVDSSTEGTTYIGTARYPRPGYNDINVYCGTANECDNIRRIRKVVESNGSTAIYYPNGDFNNNFAWNCRASYCYL